MTGAAEAARRAVLAATVAAPGETELADVAERVAREVSAAEPSPARQERAERFAAWMREAAFLPSVPTLANAGRGGQLAACFVLEPDDSLDSIYVTLARAARVQQGSGGVGVHFSRLRPRGAPIARTGGVSPGPTAFVELFAHSARVNSLAGRRSGAHLAVLRDDHPDVMEFVRAAREREAVRDGVSLAVGISDALLDAARTGADHPLHHPRGDAARRIAARELLDEIARSVHASGEPTLLFLDRIAAGNPVPELGPIEATNPCGEQPLLPGESCVLGSLHLPAFADPKGAIDADRLREATADAVRFLDDVVEVTAPPDDGIATATLRTRKLGLGVMGLADLLLLRGIRYGGPECLRLAHELMSCVAAAAHAASEDLARERGAFPAWSGGPHPRRNASLLAVAPTGTLRLLAGCNGGLEPWLHPVAVVRTRDAPLHWVDRWLEAWILRESADPARALEALEEGSPANALPGLDEEQRSLLRPAWEVSPEEQLALQAVFQAHVDGAVSKTVHLPSSTPPERIAELIVRAHFLGCKGVAFYRPPESQRATPPQLDLRGRVCVECEA